MIFVDDWRRRKSAAFDLEGNSTAGKLVEFDLCGRPVRVYANANLSIYSAQQCNARCPFCVEELRPASRGTELLVQKKIELDDKLYFARLERALVSLKPLNPSVSITGGEPSIDPRLPAILRLLARHGARKRTLTTNGSGLLDMREDRCVLDWLTSTGVQHLNISRAHPNQDANARLMQLKQGLGVEQLREAVDRARIGGTRVRLSCVLTRDGIDDIDGVVRYLNFAAGIGVDNVIFRQLMKTDAATVARNSIVRFSDVRRVLLEPILDQINSDARFEFRRQIVGYYYYVEVWRYAHLDVVFEEADLAHLEAARQARPEIIHELIFHPNGLLCSTWQPWDGVLG